ncbi:Hypothetical protein CpCap5W_0722 [Corynebacterium pseudotuberculosis]|uniref:Uncharacterized protein n=1 Tax=Corynebacterium pseudotuberculosis (strain C231) TaxID=681645 RepID=D9QCU3_CORP2|nr:hypothetical protein CPC231_09710 [Corynebacterium pseudotuberculosis C231]ADL21780.1 hypothetical protein CP1002_03430 [Corynebacterium pseudotuberculosis 1002]ADO27178.1 hypothetical protein CPI19_09735 [Corynebacterium pseudotuberculosis I19]AEK93240.1 Hypothetical protein CpPAT10_1930 [Corynebacterium pseudotuberculosis PAT10]AEP71146.1 Hypothetical protein Cp4202_1917 [Corynebacterium pseudotuberculosis 42/02-A]AEX40421.1 Hypothetical protein Cp3995_1977 [Corynebacterium pseudotubercul
MFPNAVKPSPEQSQQKNADLVDSPAPAMHCGLSLISKAYLHNTNGLLITQEKWQHWAGE